LGGERFHPFNKIKRKKTSQVKSFLIILGSFFYFVIHRSFIILLVMTDKKERFLDLCFLRKHDHYIFPFFFQKKDKFFQKRSFLYLSTCSLFPNTTLFFLSAFNGNKVFCQKKITEKMTEVSKKTLDISHSFWCSDSRSQ